MITKVIALVLVLLLIGVSPDVRAAETRDAWLWPFSSTSAWNMPVGSNAVFVPAGIPKPTKVATDEALIVRESQGDRSVPVVQSSSIARCSGSLPTNQSVRLQDTIIFPSVSASPSESNPSAFLSTDQSIWQYTQTARCTQGGNVYGVPYTSTKQFLYSDGSSCCSRGLSPLGGVIRTDELTGSRPIRHALKISLPSTLYSARPGFTWPLTKASASLAFYRGSNPSLTHGSLLAIQPTVTAASLGVTSIPGRKLFKALQDYGAYVSEAVPETNVAYFAIDQAAESQFLSFYGYPFESTSGRFYEELSTMVQSLRVIANNSSKFIGGGGTPRTLLAPSIN